jgi:hypothetical protein
MQTAWEMSPTTGNVLSRTFATYRANFLPLITLSLIVTVPLVLLSAYLTLPLLERVNVLVEELPRLSSGTPISFDQSLLNQLVSVYASLLFTSAAVSFVQTVLVYGAITHIASEHQFGRQIGLIEAFRDISGRLPLFSLGLLFVSVLIGIVAMALAVVFFLCGFGFGVIAWLSITLTPLLAPVFILERTRLFSGVNRAFSLGKLHLWPIFRVVLMMSVATSLLISILNFALPNIDQGTRAGQAITLTGSYLVSQLISGLFTAVLVPLLPIACTILYYDARVRYEGLDAQLAVLTTPSARPADVESPPGGPIFSQKDVSSIILMTVIVIGLLIAFYVAFFSLATVLNPQLFRGLG